MSFTVVPVRGEHCRQHQNEEIKCIENIVIAIIQMVKLQLESPDTLTKKYR